MAGRGRVPRQPVDAGRRGYPEFHDGPYARGPGPRPPHPARLEEEIEIRNADIRRLLADNNTLAEDRHVLQRELAAVKDDVKRLNFIIIDSNAEREAQNRDLIEKGLKLEVEIRATEPLRNKVFQLRSDVQKLSGMKEDLAGQVKNLSHELTRAQADNKQVNAMWAAMINGHGRHGNASSAINLFEEIEKGRRSPSCSSSSKPGGRGRSCSSRDKERRRHNFSSKQEAKRSKLVWSVVTDVRAKDQLASEGLSLCSATIDGQKLVVAFGGYNGTYNNEVCSIREEKINGDSYR